MLFFFFILIINKIFKILKKKWRLRKKNFKSTEKMNFKKNKNNSKNNLKNNNSQRNKITKNQKNVLNFFFV